MYLVFGLFVLVGQFLFALGCHKKSIYWMLFGRVIFGLGGECIGLCLTALIVKWFLKNEMGLPMGLSISIARLGSVVNGVLCPQLSNLNGVSFPLWMGFFMCVFSFVCIIIVCVLDRRVDDKIGKEGNVNAALIDEESSEPEIRKNLLETKQKKQSGQLNTIFWLLTIFILCFYGALIPFNYIASGFFVETYFNDIPKDKAQIAAGIYISIPYFMSTFLIPLNGLIVDKIGKRTNILLISSILGLTAFSLFFFLPPLFSLFLLGFTYSLVAATVWPCISLVVDSEIIGFSYGLIGSLQNISLVFLPMITAFLIKYSKTFYVAILFFILLLAFGLIITILITIEDQAMGNILSKSKIEIEEYKKSFRLNMKEEKEFKRSFYKSITSSLKPDFP